MEAPWHSRVSCADASAGALTMGEETWVSKAEKWQDVRGHGSSLVLHSPLGSPPLPKSMELGDQGLAVRHSSQAQASAVGTQAHLHFMFVSPGSCW